MSATSILEKQEVRKLEPARGERLASLDIFRGATIAAMILVNDPGDWGHVYWPLEHAQWNGWTPTDLIFPFFLFIVGVSMVFSFAARRTRGATRGELLRHAAWRSFVIVAIGLLLNGAPFFAWAGWRIPGVLQRIALAYFLSVVIVLLSDSTGERPAAGTLQQRIDGILEQTTNGSVQRRADGAFGLNTGVIAGATVVIVAAYWLAMKLVPVPGYGAGVLTPEGNLAAYIDRTLLYNHLYVAHRWDPEGLFSTLPAVATTLIGVLAGWWLLAGSWRGATPSKAAKAAAMAGFGVVGMAAGEVMNRWLPINKNIWSSSYVVFTGGFALLLLALCYWVVEVRGWRAWGKPFLIYGSNAIVVYAASSLVGKISISVHVGPVLLKTWAYHKFFAPLAAPYHASLLWALAYVITFWVLAWILWRKRIFIKI